MIPFSDRAGRDQLAGLLDLFAPAGRDVDDELGEDRSFKAADVLLAVVARSFPGEPIAEVASRLSGRLGNHVNEAVVPELKDAMRAFGLDGLHVTTQPPATQAAHAA